VYFNGKSCPKSVLSQIHKSYRMSPSQSSQLLRILSER